MVLVFLANGFEEIEAITSIDVLRRSGLPVCTVSIHSTREVTGAHGLTVLADKLFKEVDYTQADAIVLPGGMPGTLNLKAHEGLKVLLMTFAQDQEKTVAAICAAPSILGELGLLSKKKATCYPGFENLLAGARIAAEPVVRDGNIITANGPGHAMDFALKIAEYLTNRHKADEVAKGLNI